MEEPDAKRLKTSSETYSDVIPSYGLVLEKVGKCLTKDNVIALATIANLFPSEKDQVTLSEGNGWRLLCKFLEQKGTISRCDLGWLQQNLGEIDNNMAAKLIDDLKSETEEEFKLPSEPECSGDEAEDDETTFEKFLEEVGLKDKFPGKLKLKTFLQLGTNEQSNYAQIFWQKLTTLNYHAGMLQEIVSQDFSMRDFIFCLLQCGDDFLRQDILEKMSACQLAVPVVIQGVANGKPTFLLWGLRRVMKKWRGDSDSVAIEQPIISYPVLNISFLRVGDVRLSKSQLMNSMLSDIQGYLAHTFFLNREKDFAKARFSPGSVECVWFLPMRESDKQIFKEVIAFFNLRGDCTKYPRQTEFVCKAAHLTVALVTTSEREGYKNYIKQIMKDSKSTLFISISGEESRRTTCKKVHRLKYNKGFIFVNEVQMDILSKKICEEIVKTSESNSTAKTSLESLTDICNEYILIDEQNEHCKNGRLSVRKIFTEGETVDKLDILDFKKQSFPLQLIWKDWVEIDKAPFQMETDASNSLEHQMERKTLEKREKRKLQLQKRLSPAMKLYLQIMKSAISNSALLQYIFTFMQEKIYHLVNENTRSDMNDIAELEREIRQMRDQKLAGLYGNDNDSNSDLQGKIEDRHQSTYTSKVNECTKLYKSCRAKTLGGEHFLRELGQLYEAYMDLEEEEASQTEEATTLNVTLLPSLAARLVTEMQSLEIMDGDTGCVPLTWVTSVLDTLTRDLNNPKVLVLSVIGVQSSGKSTLLNSMFGVRFPVRAGRCTRGLFIQLLKLSDRLLEELGFHYLVVVDSEGIRSIDHDDRRFDNELVTLALSIANVTIFNIEGENIGPDMTGILQIAAHALMRMKEVDLECHCRIVQQRVSDMTAADRNKANTKKINETLDEATRFAAEEEGLEGRYRQFSDVVDLHVDEDLQYVPCLWAGGMAPPNHLYSETVSKIKDNLFRDIEKGSISTDLTLSSFTERVRDVWKAIKEEDFVFNFHDSVKAVDYNKFCLGYNQWIAQMRQDVQIKICNILSSVKPDPENESLKPDVETLKVILESEIKEQRHKLTKCVKDHISNHPRKNTMLRHRQKFLHDVSFVLNETETHALAKITDEYEIKRINLNLPYFRKKSRQILTRQAREEATKMAHALPDLESDHFDIIWQNMLDKLKRENNITRVTMTTSFLRDMCLKLLLKVTRDMAVGSEIQTLLSQEGGITNHLSLKDCSKYITVKFVKSWLRHGKSSTSETEESIRTENEGQLKEEARGHSVVVEMFPSVKIVKVPQKQFHSAASSDSKTKKGERIPSETEKQLMEVKRQQAISFLKETVEQKLSQMQRQSEAFDANVFQLMLQKTLKTLSTKQDTLNIKLPYRLIAKGLLCFCGRSVNECFTDRDSDIENFLDFDRDVIHSVYHSFLYHAEQDAAAVNFICYYTEKAFLEKAATYGKDFYSSIDYSQYAEHVYIPWDILYFLFTSDDIIDSWDGYFVIALNYSLQEIVNLYVESKQRVCSEDIGLDCEAKTDSYITKLISEIENLQFRATSWNAWCKLLGKFLDCPFIASAGDLFRVTNVSHVSEILQTNLRSSLLYNSYAELERFDHTAFKNAAGLSFVCDQVCPMCGAWCDNILESHTVHSSDLHRPRGLIGETYPDNDTVTKELSSDSDSDNRSDFESSLNSNAYGEQFVLEDCFTSISSEKATFAYNGERRLCKEFKKLFPNWDIQPGKGNASNRLFWQHFFAGYYDDEACNIPSRWYNIRYDEVVQSLEQAKRAQLQGRKSLSDLPLKKRLLASCSKTS